ncbi:PD-(D/E)XK nuclease family protein [Coraliomargarita sp. SDUM461003]|uniref:PD-(D/E)XK nuclease family protein n=1 Tax=Thalassobacterium maritimum TaxID=3041265 RepID=A0ABU1AS79_9BACT|nr:PD-(D/E)XK nuclease family protein [Coraliomargarita sp. SDUM461003]MDQ8207010.1 PD-(D/E)XK nuclease family protein [Coraliomargarita sp. SDUM461003]
MSTSTTHKALELLQLTQTICHYEAELERETGGNFNLMQILGVGHYEVKTHSPILAELLNPKGSHGQGAAFLDLFIDQLEITDFDTTTARVDQEYHIGPVTKTSGGRIDILLRDAKGGCIMIENKIYAEEQQNQILRYHNAFKEGHILFLTLDGSPPVSIAKTHPDKLQSIAYATHIIDWLEACRKEATTVPTVRESITQYIHLIKALTNQNTNSRMSQKITAAALQNPESLQAFFAVRNAESDVKRDILNTFREKLTLLAEKHKLHLSGPEDDFGAVYSSASFHSDNWPTPLCICFEFQGSNFSNLIFGLSDQGKLEQAVRNTFRESFNKTYGNSKQTGYWPAWNYWSRHRNWNADTFQAIQFGHFVDDLEHELIQMIDIINTVLKGQQS